MKMCTLAEMLICRHLDLLSEIAAQEGLEVVVEQVASAHNWSDKLMHVPKKWLTAKSSFQQPTGSAAAGRAISNGNDATQQVISLHVVHHFGMDQTLELVHAKLGQQVSEVGAECCLCMSTVCVHQPSCHVPLAGGHSCHRESVGVTGSGSKMNQQKR